MNSARDLRAVARGFPALRADATLDYVDRFFSHRGERVHAGRNLAFLGWRR